MRDIIFRGKRIEDGKWIYGYYLDGKTSMADFPCIAPFSGDAYDDDNDWEVDIETVGQYTGLCDKNDTKIFEGDIVKVENALVRGIFAVEYCGISACFIVSHGERRYFLGGCNSEVIGNIHDNPELLKE